MLQHEPPDTEQMPSAAERRVTPEELAKALAAVEARKEQSARQQENTIPIGEAVQQIGFDATPEQIWAEVQAQRQNQDQAMRRLPKKARRRLWLALCVVFPVLIGMMAAIEGHSGISNETPSVTDISSPQVFIPTTPPTIIKTLAEIPNNGTFFCDEDTAQGLLQKKVNANHVLVTEVQPFTGQQNNSWTFTKHDDKLYLHGYTALRSPEAIQLGHVPIYNTRVVEAGTGINYDQPITLAVGEFRRDSFDDNGPAKELTVSAIHPDQHFKDNW